MRRVAVFIAGPALAVTGCLPEPKTPLTRAAVAGPEDAFHKRQVAAVRALLEAGADSNTRHGGGSTPLMFAAAYGNVAIVRDLLDHGADPRARRPDGLDALANAVGSGALFDFTDGPPLATCHPAVVRELLARAPDLDLRPAAGPGVKLARWLGASRGCPEAFALLAARDAR